MSKICEMKIQEDTKAYTLDVEGMRRIQDEQMESTTYVEVLSFLKDMFNNQKIRSSRYASAS